MQPADAVEFFRAQGIRGTHTEIETACKFYGYHPLSLGILAGWIAKDFQQPGDIAAAQRLDVNGNLIQRQKHVLKVAYESLTLTRQALLGRIACFRSSVKYEALQALAATGVRRRAKTHSKKGSKGHKKSERLAILAIVTKELDADLRDLVARGLLHHDTKEGRFDLHPIVRRCAYRRLDESDRITTHARLRDYFAAVPTPDKVTSLADLAPVIERYHHTVRAGQYDEAQRLFRDRLDALTFYQFGAYHLQIDLLRALFPDGEDRPPRLKDESAQASTLNSLANSYSVSGQPGQAAHIWQLIVPVAEKLGEENNLAIGLINVAVQQLVMGVLRTAEANLRRSITLCRKTKHEFGEAAGHAELGRLLAHRGAWVESDTELAVASKMFDMQKELQYHGVTWAYRALREILRLRSISDSAFALPRSAIESARRALELANQDASTTYPVERDYVRTHWLLGAAHRAFGQTDDAERHLHEGLERCRRINNVDHEDYILIDLARLRAVTGAPNEAQRFAEEARNIAERSGYVLQGADAHLELAKLALARDNKPTALEHAKEARRLATCDGPPDYTYKVAYDEAGALLAQLEQK